MLKLSNIKAPVGSNHAPLRKGRGIGSGLGKTAGKGHKGQKARTGAPIHPSFEGGQMPIHRRSPKVGFRSPLKRMGFAVNVTELAKYAGQALTLKDLFPKTFGARSRITLSIEGTRAPSAYPKSVEAHRVAPAAKKLLESNGVKITIVELPAVSKSAD
ncbi:MAG: 50S ribosomal protein L15 [Bdellovibrionales bacterium]|nr:50S ribosomal protein L15 [Bdellovibrionales bacterium]